MTIEMPQKNVGGVLESLSKIIEKNNYPNLFYRDLF